MYDILDIADKKTAVHHHIPVFSQKKKKNTIGNIFE